MKKLLSVVLALVLCMSLTVPALAADAGYYEEATKNIDWTSDYLDRTGLEEQDMFVKKNITIDEDIVQGYGLPAELDGYVAIPKDIVFTIKHTGTVDDGTYITVEGYELRYWDGVYGEPGINYYLYLYEDGKFLVWDEMRDEEAVVKLKAGQSVQFTMKDIHSEASPIHYDYDENDSIYLVQAVMNDPKNDTHIALNDYFKFDEAAVAAALNKKPASGVGFTDVVSNSPYLDAIKWAVEKDVTKGTSATTFSPNQYCSITQILTFLWRANGRPDAGSDEQAAVTAWAKSKGINAPEGTNQCTRATAVMYMWQAAGKPEPKSTTSFSDVPADASYAKAVSWAVEQGITTGKTANSFAPNDNCTRGQIVTFIYRHLVK